MEKLAFFVAVLAIALHAGITERREQRHTAKTENQEQQDQASADASATAQNDAPSASQQKSTTTQPSQTASAETTSKPIPTKITWLSLEEAEAAMKENPKKLYVDVYTEWCGWCKVQDRKTFVNPEIIRLMSEHFYAVKFDAEGRDSVTFNGQKFGFMPNMGRKGLNGWAHKYARNNGSLGYPTSLFFNENLEREQVLATYLDPAQMEMVLTYIGKSYPQKGIGWDQFTASFKGKVKTE